MAGQGRCTAHPKGWYQIGFIKDLCGDLTAARLGAKHLLLLRAGSTVRAFDAHCPHRGAHLAHGGRLEAGGIICPYHGYTVGLEAHHRGPFRVREYAVTSAGGMLFVRLSPDRDNGWPEFAAHLSENYHLITGFELRVRASMATVIENAFDRRHFEQVHKVRTTEFLVHYGDQGQLIVESTFLIPSARQNSEGTRKTPYRAIVFSPGLAFVELLGDQPYGVVTGATDDADGECVVRITLSLPRAAFGKRPPKAFYEHLLQHARRGLEEDATIWNTLATDAAPLWMKEDAPTQEFLRFCKGFEIARCI